jgi:membrane associated rhomboid family serine protease
VTRGVQRAAAEGTTAKVTRALIGLNVAVYVAELATGGTVNGVGSTIYDKGFLAALQYDSHGHLVGVARHEYWRLITAAFLHYGPLHLLLNMLALYWFGSLLERRIGSGKYLLLYLVSGLAGSAGALIASPLTPTVGASGAIFGILGAGFVLERRGDYVFGGSALGIIVINLVFTVSIANISIGGHIGGLIGGVIAALGMTQFGRVHAAYGRTGVLGVATMVLVGVASFVIAYFKSKGYAA